MEELTKIARMLGEENEQKLKDGITQMLLNQAERDLEDKYQYDYSVDFDDIYDEIKREIKTELKERLKKRYMESIDKKMEEWLGGL